MIYVQHWYDVSSSKFIAHAMMRNVFREEIDYGVDLYMYNKEDIVEIEDEDEINDDYRMAVRRRHA